jgi:hypothetical protein
VIPLLIFGVRTSLDWLKVVIMDTALSEEEPFRFRSVLLLLQLLINLQIP